MRWARCMSPAAPDLARQLRWALDPISSAVDELGFVPDRWQQRFLRSPSRGVLLNVCRQAGKSTTAAVLALHTARYRPRALILLVSPSSRQSGELFKKVVEFRDRLDPRPALSEDNALSCAFTANGSRIVSLPGSDTTVRGFSAPDLIIEDEAALVEDALFRSMTPMLATRPDGKHVLMSTPRGQRGHFWDLWSAGGDAWERIEIQATDVPRIDPAFLERERQSMGAEWFGQEYLCRFSRATGQLFAPEDLARAISDDVTPLFPIRAAASAGSADVLPLVFPVARRSA